MAVPLQLLLGCFFCVWVSVFLLLRVTVVCVTRESNHKTKQQRSRNKMQAPGQSCVCWPALTDELSKRGGQRAAVGDSSGLEVRLVEQGQGDGSC